MTPFTPPFLDSLRSATRSKTIAVVGDVMIDRYIWGKVNRISPEAPVPVVEVESESHRLGGAANVAANIASLGATALLVGVVGDDADGRMFREILVQQNASADGIVSDPSRPTTVKTRVIAHDQHVVRIDSEAKSDVAASIAQQLYEAVERNIASIDGIIVEDYNKGVVTADLIRSLIALANRHNTIITIDPKFHHFFEYTDVTVFKPNRKETEDALGRKLVNEEDVRTAGRELLERLRAKNILLTRSEKGMSLYRADGSEHHFPTNARSVVDVSGAGDTVIATLTVMLAAGATVPEAAALANIAGGIVCGSVGIVPIDPDELIAVALGQGR